MYINVLSIVGCSMTILNSGNFLKLYTLLLFIDFRLVWLPWQQKAPIRLIMGKWLNCICSITSQVM